MATAFNELITRDEYKSGIIPDSTLINLELYFREIKIRFNSGDMFPYDLEELVPVIFSTKSNAVQALSDNKLTQNIDYITRTITPSPNNNKILQRPITKYFLDSFNFELFVVRKVAPIYRVYYNIFHKVTSTDSKILSLENSVSDLIRAVTDSNQQRRGISYV